MFSHNGRVPENYMSDDSIYYTPDALQKADFICGTTYIYPWREKFFDFAGTMQVSDLLIVRTNRNQKSVIEHFFQPEKLQTKKEKFKIKKIQRLSRIENCNFSLQIHKEYGILFLEHSAVIMRMEEQHDVCILWVIWTSMCLPMRSARSRAR